MLRLVVSQSLTLSCSPTEAKTYPDIALSCTGRLDRPPSGQTGGILPRKSGPDLDPTSNHYLHETGQIMSELDLPRFAIVGSRPVKAIDTPDGGMDVLAYDWESGEFVRDMQYLTRLFMPDGEVELVSEAQFDQAVKALRGNGDDASGKDGS